MTLFRQLIIFTLVLFVFLFFGTWSANLANVRAFLAEQLDSHAQDTATSLGLSIAPHLSQKDMALVDTMCNAIFDRGYYRSIRLENLAGEVLLERKSVTKFDAVPAWFVSLVELKTPEKSTIVTSGWRRAGMLYVQSHPGYAYLQLWETASGMLFWFAVTAAIVLIFGGLSLKLLLKPLSRVEKQAEAISNRRFELQEKLPYTREFRRVVEAMNQTAMRVQAMFEKQIATAERLRQDAYEDTVTGLGNRRFFETQVKTRLDRGELSNHGILLLVQLNDLKKINETEGYEAGDERLCTVASSIDEVTRRFSQRIIAHLTGGDFGILVPDAGMEDAEQVAHLLSVAFASYGIGETGQPANVGVIGGAVYEHSCEYAELLSVADQAIAVARSGLASVWSIQRVAQAEKQEVKGKIEWQQELNQLIQNANVCFHLQKVVHAKDDQQLLHYEVLSRVIKADGDLVSAGVYLPMAERLGLAANFDRMIIENVLSMVVPNYPDCMLAINLSPSSLRNDQFCDWLLDKLQSIPAGSARLVFEFAEFGAVQHLELLCQLSLRLQKLGHGLALDHYGQSFANFGYLQSLRPEYVKIDRAYTAELKQAKSDNRFFIGSLCSAAHSLDIAVIAEGIEEQNQVDILLELHIDGFQGYRFGRPEAAKL